MAEKNLKDITIHDVDPLALTLLVDFSYTGELSVCEENVQVDRLDRPDRPDRSPEDKNPTTLSGSPSRLINPADDLGTRGLLQVSDAPTPPDKLSGDQELCRHSRLQRTP